MFGNRIVKSFENIRIPNRHFTNVYNDIISPESEEINSSDYDENSNFGNPLNNNEWDDLCINSDIRELVHL